MVYPNARTYGKLYSKAMMVDGVSSFHVKDFDVMNRSPFTIVTRTPLCVQHVDVNIRVGKIVILCRDVNLKRCDPFLLDII